MHPNATELRDHLAMRKDEYGWDASLMERICGLNTRNLNLMLNSFSMADYETYVPSDAIKKGMAFISAKLRHDNSGPMWWEDANAHRDLTESIRDKRDRSEPNRRGRSTHARRTYLPDFDAMGRRATDDAEPKAARAKARART